MVVPYDSLLAVLELYSNRAGLVQPELAKIRRNQSASSGQVKGSCFVNWNSSRTRQSYEGDEMVHLAGVGWSTFGSCLAQRWRRRGKKELLENSSRPRNSLFSNLWSRHRISDNSGLRPNPEIRHRGWAVQGFLNTTRTPDIPHSLEEIQCLSY